MQFKHRMRFVLRAEMVWVSALAVGMVAASAAMGTIPTTLRDFFLGGSQPGDLIFNIAPADECFLCHAQFDPQTEPGRPWAASMMGQSARDPVFYAALAVANNDAQHVGDLCLRCHAPGAWMEGRSFPTDGSAMIAHDFQGVSCNFCHRMVDPVYSPGNPVEDLEILANLKALPVDPHSANYVVDFYDRRRGPYELDPLFPAHDWFKSPFHESSRMCATCHDVSNPVYERQPDGRYVLGPLDEPNPSGSKFDQFPLERTYSEWAASAFAQGPINMGGRFGGNLLEVSTCQDCHMPPTTGLGCVFGEVRNDLPTHYFNGGNTWVLRAIRNLYPDSETFMDEQSVSDSINRTVDMLKAASDLELSVEGSALKVRIINQSGHKLPTGYPEGRRMWINVKFFDAQGQVIAERGAYDFTTATLTAEDTKVYEGKLGVDAEVSGLTGIPEGPSFHFALNNKWYFDNRIPPRGFTNAGFEAVQAAPIGYTYADGQHWDDTLYDLPPGAVSAAVTVYFQTTSREYIEFLRDRGGKAGEVAYDQWVLTGKSSPVVMDHATITLPCYANCDGSTIPPVLNVNDFLCFQTQYAMGSSYANCDGSTIPPVLNVNDFLCFMNRFAEGCPE